MLILVLIVTSFDRHSCGSDLDRPARRHAAIDHAKAWGAPRLAHAVRPETSTGSSRTFAAGSSMVVGVHQRHALVSTTTRATIPEAQHAVDAPPQHADAELADALYDQALLAKDLSAPGRRVRRRRCRQVRGTWCGQLDRQPPVPKRTVPRGDKPCLDACNGVGVCNFDTGICDCPAGYTGDDCKTAFKRPCTNRHRDPWDAKHDKMQPASHIDALGRDLDWMAPGWTASRCGGICDDTDASCWCDGTHGRKPAPPGSPPGTPPLQRGRPLSDWCSKPLETHDGRRTSWGKVPFKKLYEPGKGWCEADTPEPDYRCNCELDGLGGQLCDVPLEPFCLGQCSGHGECRRGFCKCHEGWYGTDCSRKVAGAVMEPPLGLGPHRWLTGAGVGVLPPAAAHADPAAAATAGAVLMAGAVKDKRKRPLIYVYDVPAEFTQRMLQYRLLGRACVYRRFGEGNTTVFNDWTYGAEVYLHEMLLLSSHRTFDPDEADFFYVPLYITCYFWPIIGWADAPWWEAPTVTTRVMHGANMALKAKRWLQRTFPFWDRHAGRDHIFFIAADEGACWLPREVYNTSIILTHWGRMDTNHTSNTAYDQDDYNVGFKQLPWQPHDWRADILGHECYNPVKDLVIPSLKPPTHYAHSPLMGAQPLARDILLYFRGDVGHARTARYSRGIRQRLYKLSLERQWRDKHKIFIGTTDELPGPYSQHLARSRFCLVAPGDGFATRAEDSILHGCIPVVIMDQVHAVFESILDWDTFSVRVGEGALEQLPEVLLAYTDEQVMRMQRRLAQVWHRFAYMSGKVLQDEAARIIRENLRSSPAGNGTLPTWFPLPPSTTPHVEDDALATLMQWLYARIPATR